MGRLTVATRGILLDTGPGPIRATIELHGQALSLFSKHESNAIVRTALQAGGDMWIVVFLPKRFSEYARQLGYTIRTKYKDWKEKNLGAAVPFVGIGGAAGAADSTIVAAARAHAKATATGSAGVIIIRIPTGHPLQAKEQAAMRTVPAHEVARIAAEIHKTLVDLLSGYSVKTLRSGRMIATLGGSRGPAQTSTPRGPAAAGSRKAA